MIIETSSNHLYQVRDTDDKNLPHVWWGIAVKPERYAEGNAIKVRYVFKGTPVERLIRKAGCKVVQP